MGFVAILILQLASVYAANKQEEFKEPMKTRLTEIGQVFKALFAEINVRFLPCGR